MTDITRLLLEARRSLAAELDADLAERGFPTCGPAMRPCSCRSTGARGRD